MTANQAKLTKRQRLFLQIFVEAGGQVNYGFYRFHIGRGANPDATFKALKSRGLIELTQDHRDYVITDAGRAALNGVKS